MSKRASKSKDKKGSGKKQIGREMRSILNTLDGEKVAYQSVKIFRNIHYEPPNMYGQFQYVDDNTGNLKEALIDIDKEIGKKPTVKNNKTFIKKILNHVSEMGCKTWGDLEKQLADLDAGTGEYHALIQFCVRLKFDGEHNYRLHTFDCKADGTRGYRPAEFIADLDQHHKRFGYSSFLPTNGRFQVKF